MIPLSLYLKALPLTAAELALLGSLSPAGCLRALRSLGYLTPLVSAKGLSTGQTSSEEADLALLVDSGWQDDEYPV